MIIKNPQNQGCILEPPPAIAFPFTPAIVAPDLMLPGMALVRSGTPSVIPFPPVTNAPQTPLPLLPTIVNVEKSELDSADVYPSHAFIASCIRLLLIVSCDEIPIPWRPQ